MHSSTNNGRLHKQIFHRQWSIQHYINRQFGLTPRSQGWDQVSPGISSNESGIGRQTVGIGLQTCRHNRGTKHFLRSSPALTVPAPRTTVEGTHNQVNIFQPLDDEKSSSNLSDTGEGFVSLQDNNPSRRTSKAAAHLENLPKRVCPVAMGGPVPRNSVPSGERASVKSEARNHRSSIGSQEPTTLEELQSNSSLERTSSATSSPQRGRTRDGGPGFDASPTRTPRNPCRALFKLGSRLKMEMHGLNLLASIVSSRPLNRSTAAISVDFGRNRLWPNRVWRSGGSGHRSTHPTVAPMQGTQRGQLKHHRGGGCNHLTCARNRAHPLFCRVRQMNVLLARWYLRQRSTSAWFSFCAIADGVGRRAVLD